MTYIFAAAWLVTLGALIHEWAEKCRLERENIHLDGMNEYLKNEIRELDGMSNPKRPEGV